jgi:hypothetical protein
MVYNILFQWSQMLYFTPKGDLKTVGLLFALEQRYLEAYFQLLQYAESKQLTVFPLNVLPQEVQKQHLEHAKTYSDLRASVNEQVHPFEQLTERYRAVDPTSYFLETTKLPGNRSAPPLPQQSSAGHFQKNTGHLEGDEIRWGR